MIPEGDDCRRSMANLRFWVADLRGMTHGGSEGSETSSGDESSCEPVSDGLSTDLRDWVREGSQQMGVPECGWETDHRTDIRGSVSAPGIVFDPCPTGDLLGGAHSGYGIFGFSPSFTNFLPFFARFHHIHSLLG